MRRLLIGIAGLLLIAASPVEEADRLIHQGKGKEALAIVEKAAGAGDAEAIDYLGGLYDVGKAVEQDLARAASLYRRAAEAVVGVCFARAGLFAFGKHAEAILIEKRPNQFRWVLRKRVLANERKCVAVVLEELGDQGHEPIGHVAP